MKFLRPIITIFLAAVVLLASVGVTMNMHVCGGMIQSSALFVKAKPCGLMAKLCFSKKRVQKSKGCCEEKTIVLKSKEVNAEVGTITAVVPASGFMAIILPVLYIASFSQAKLTSTDYFSYKPPLPEHDIPVFVQSFRI